MNAEIITIGDEILIGQTIDSNSAWMAQKLNAIGIDIIRISSIKDTSEAIHTALREAEQRADLILMTGGLGPTKDDITKKSLADYFQTDLVMDQVQLDRITKIFAKWGREMLDVNRDQALVPASCEAISNPKGTAPGMLFRDKGKVYVSMPGVPYEMKAIMTSHVIPALKDDLDDLNIVHHTITVVNVPESLLSKQIEDIETALPEHIQLAYLPHLNLVRMRLSARSRKKSRKQLAEELDEIFNAIKDRIGEVWFEGDRTVSEMLGSLLIAEGATIGTVESCSGGFLAHTLTKIAGSSAYFEGSMLTYSNRLKMEKLGVNAETLNTVGAVSHEVAEQMARAGIGYLGVDYCISTTGIAGPTGGTEYKPVGLVYIGLAIKGGDTLVKECKFHGTRSQIIERTANTALNWLREILSEKIRPQSVQKPAQQ